MTMKLLQPGDRFTYHSDHPGLNHHNGKTVEVMFDLGARLAEGDPDRLYQVMTTNGQRMLAFGNELRAQS